MINSRNKGAAAEREFATLVYGELGVHLQRNLEQYRVGGYDLIAVGHSPTANYLNLFAIEAKRYRQATDAKISEWWEQGYQSSHRRQSYPITGIQSRPASLAHCSASYTAFKLPAYTIS